MRVYDPAQVDPTRLRKLFRSGVNVEDLPAANGRRLIGIIVQGKLRQAFQNGQSIVTRGFGLKDKGRAGDCDRYSFRGNFRSAGILSRVNKDRAGVQANTAAGLIDAENCVRAESRDGQIGKSKF